MSAPQSPQKLAPKRPTSGSTSFAQEAQYLKTRLESAASTLIIFDSNQVDLDQVAVATSLYLALRARQQDATLFSFHPTLVAHSALVGIDRVQTTLPQNGLVISLDNSQSAVGKIDCDSNLQKQLINIYVKNASPAHPLTTDQITFAPLAKQFDQIIVIGFATLNALEDLGLTDLGREHLLVISPNLHPSFTQSKALYICPQNMASCTSELFANLTRQWIWNLNADIATNLLMGIDEATQNLSDPQTPASAFEATAWLLRSGGQRYLPELAARQVQAQPLARSQSRPQPQIQTAPSPAPIVPSPQNFTTPFENAQQSSDPVQAADGIPQHFTSRAAKISSLYQEITTELQPAQGRPAFTSHRQAGQVSQSANPLQPPFSSSSSARRKRRKKHRPNPNYPQQGGYQNP